MAPLHTFWEGRQWQIPYKTIEPILVTFLYFLFGACWLLTIDYWLSSPCLICPRSYTAPAPLVMLSPRLWWINAWGSGQGTLRSLRSKCMRGYILTQHSSFPIPIVIPRRSQPEILCGAIRSKCTTWSGIYIVIVARSAYGGRNEAISGWGEDQNPPRLVPSPQRGRGSGWGGSRRLVPFESLKAKYFGRLSDLEENRRSLFDRSLSLQRNTFNRSWNVRRYFTEQFGAKYSCSRKGYRSQAKCMKGIWFRSQNAEEQAW
jgi:hypothetical protein